jgi:hypothetical protein
MIRNSPATLEDFKKSSIYQDLVEEIDTRIKLQHETLEDPDGNLTIEWVYRIQGGIKAYREMRDNLLDSLIAMSSERTES